MYQQLTTRHFLTRNVIYVHLRRIRSGGHRTQCLTIMSLTLKKSLFRATFYLNQIH